MEIDSGNIEYMGGLICKIIGIYYLDVYYRRKV